LFSKPRFFETERAAFSCGKVGRENLAFLLKKTFGGVSLYTPPPPRRGLPTTTSTPPKRTAKHHPKQQQHPTANHRVPVNNYSFIHESVHNIQGVVNVAQVAVCSFVTTYKNNYTK
jgi:hypothetical protein